MHLFSQAQFGPQSIILRPFIIYNPRAYASSKFCSRSCQLTPLSAKVLPAETTKMASTKDSITLNEAQTNFLALLMRNIKSKPDIDVRPRCLTRSPLLGTYSTDITSFSSSKVRRRCRGARNHPEVHQGALPPALDQDGLEGRPFHPEEADRCHQTHSGEGRQRQEGWKGQGGGHDSRCC